MTIAELITWFEAWANPTWQESWDNCGWQVEPGILEQPACVLICLTPTLAVMHEAIALRASGIPVNLIFAHHPLMFSSLKSLRTGDAIADQLQLAYTQRIGIYSAHTNFDQVEHGTADCLAHVMQLTHVIPMVPTQPGIGYGRVGNLPTPIALAQLLSQIQKQLSPPDLLVSTHADRKQPIQRLAVLGGSGASFLADAVKANADAYLTSDCKFHQFQESRDRGLILIDAGHYATERPACAHLVEIFKTQGVTWVKLSCQDEDFRQFHRSTIKSDD
jgi:dinuclear metal center YbgI/SA1388 family protein